MSAPHSWDRRRNEVAYPPRKGVIPSRRVPGGRRHSGQRGSAALRGAAGMRGPRQVHEDVGNYPALRTKSRRQPGVPGKPSNQRRGTSRPRRSAAAGGAGKVLRSRLLGPHDSPPSTNQPSPQAAVGSRRCPQATARRIGGFQDGRVRRTCSAGRHGLEGFVRLAAFAKPPREGGRTAPS